MKTLVIAVDDSLRMKVLDIATAVEDGVLHSEGDIPDKILAELANAAPNLALNVKNATAPQWLLWLCAALGCFLQAAALVIPGLATYFWGWEKAGLPVASYGYPCYLIGSLLVISGVAVCGHVIEGVTTEHYFNTNPERWMTTVVRLQRSCTVSDQHFSSFAIFNEFFDLQVRASRLNDNDYSTVAAAATVASVVGFIIQFVGLRALHWSATIIQLGVTLIMTGVRAFVRRGLADNPICYQVPEGHEAAWLATQLAKIADDETYSVYDGMLKLAGEAARGWVWLKLSSRMRRRLRLQKRIVQLDAFGSRPYTPRLCAIFSLRCPKVSNGLPRRLYRSMQEFGPRTPRAKDIDLSKIFGLYGVGVPLSLPNMGDVLRRKESQEVELHAKILSLMPQYDEAANVASKLVWAIERVMARCVSSGLLSWGDDNSEEPTEFGFILPIFSGELKGNATVKFLHMTVKRQASEGFNINLSKTPWSWNLEVRDYIRSVLCLWYYSLAEGARMIQKAADEVGGLHDGGLDEEITVKSVYLRVVGCSTRGTFSEDDKWQSFVKGSAATATLEGWLGKRVLETLSARGVIQAERGGALEMSFPLLREWPVFGAFFSSLSKYAPRSHF